MKINWYQTFAGVSLSASMFATGGCQNLPGAPGEQGAVIGGPAEPPPGRSLLASIIGFWELFWVARWGLAAAISSVRTRTGLPDMTRPELRPPFKTLKCTPRRLPWP